MEKRVLRTALKFAERGVRCFPLCANTKIPIAGSSGVHDATDEPNELKRMFASAPGANLAAVPGPNYVVIDIDKKGDVDGFPAWNQLLPKVPKTLRARTPSGGEHYWFRCPAPLGNTASALAEGIDTRGTNGYVVLPPSRLSNGEYEWLCDIDSSIADIPAALLSRLSVAGVRRDKEARHNEFIPEGSRNDWLFTIGCSFRARGFSSRQVFAELLAINKTECQPPLPRIEVKAIVRSIRRYSKSHSLTETGNAGRFATRHEGAAIYVLEQKEWYVPDRGIWVPDKKGLCVRYMMRVASDLKKDAEALEQTASKKLMQWANRSLSKSVLCNSLELAKSAGAMSVSISDFNNYPMLLVLKNGILDLRTGSLREHDLSQLHTKRAGVIFDEDAECPKFRSFLDTIFAGEQDLIAYVQRLCGYVLTGRTSEQVFTIFHGSGKNGKSTLLLILRAILGDYARHVQPEIISDSKRSPNGASPSLARLVGARLVTTTETEGNHRLGESLVKQVTGSDPVEARHLYKEPFEFVPSFKLILATNHKPAVSGNDCAIWRRLHLVPFSEQIHDDDCIPNYHETLLEEASGILNWAIEGCLEWQVSGLNPPDAVVRATNEYRDEQDTVTQFLQEIDFDCGEKPRPELYRIFKAWAESNSKEVISNIRLYEELEQYGCGVKTVRGTKIVTGLPVRDRNEIVDDDWDV